MTLSEQKKILAHVRAKVKKLFADSLAPAHDYDHALRVAKWALVIGHAEHSKRVWLLEVIALLHDIGRTLEKQPGLKKTHHELSYELCRKWFRHDSLFDVLDKKTKLLILYSIRYHWNDAATKYTEAVILRDADKLDALGPIGVRRSVEYFEGDFDKVQHDLRLHYQMAVCLRTPKAKEILKKKKYIAFVERYLFRMIRSRIYPVSL